LVGSPHRPNQLKSESPHEPNGEAGRAAVMRAHIEPDSGRRYGIQGDVMDSVAQVAALIGALAYLGAAPLELFFFDRPWARAFLHVDADGVADVRMWAFVAGFRNVLAGAGAITGLAVMHLGDSLVGRTIVITASVYMLLASVAMGIADLLGYWRPRGGSVLGTMGSSSAAPVALIAFVM
jgi:putative membrane protein